MYDGFKKYLHMFLFFNEIFFILLDSYVAFVIIKKLSGISFLIQVNIKYLDYYHFLVWNIILKIDRYLSKIMFALIFRMISQIK